MTQQSHSGVDIQKKKKKLIQEDPYTSKFIAALFTIAKIWKPPKCPTIDEWIKMWLYMSTMEYYSAITIMEFCHLQQHDGHGGH